MKHHLISRLESDSFTTKHNFEFFKVKEQINEKILSVSEKNNLLVRNQQS